MQRLEANAFPRYGRRLTTRGAFLKHWSTTLIFVLVLAATSGFGRVRYLATWGVDVADGGTSAIASWRTFPFAIQQLAPGDELLVQPGTWTWADGGVLEADCTATTRNGLPDAGITVRAAVERSVRIISNGAKAAVRVNGCSHWSIAGLTLEGGDFPGGDSTLAVNASANVTLRRMLVSGDNRYENTMPLAVADSTDVLIEECEVYDYFRVGFEVWHSSRVVVRRCYANSRGRAALDGGYPRNEPTRADQSYSSDSPNILIENSVSEGARAGFFFYTTGVANDGRYLGDLSVLDFHGVLFQSGQNGAYGTNNLVQDFVAFRPRLSGIDWRDTRGTRCEGCTVFQSAGDGFVADQERGSSSGLSVAAHRMLVTGLDAGYGATIVAGTSYALSDVNAWGFAIPAAPATIPVTAVDPGLGSCAVMIPESSPMKRAAADGGDIGANLLYRYQDGQLTNEPLWRPGFPCGAIVPGVNDVPDASCFDLHLRLGLASCAFPAGYLSAPDAGLAFTTQPEPQLVCGRPWHYAPTVGGAGPFVFELDGAPAGATVDATTGAVDWVPTRAEAGDVRFVLRARGAGGAASQELALTVQCAPAALEVACGCGAGSGGFAALAWVVLLAWRRRRLAWPASTPAEEPPPASPRG